MIFRELSNTVFRFVLPCAGAEIDGGCSNPPPPPASRGKSRGPSGRGVKMDEKMCSCEWGIFLWLTEITLCHTVLSFLFSEIIASPLSLTTSLFLLLVSPVLI